MIFAGIDEVAPGRLTAGQHQLVRVHGWAYALRSRVVSVVTTIDGQEHPARHLRAPSPEVELVTTGTARMSAHARQAGFAVFAVVGPLAPGAHAVTVVVTTEDDEQLRIEVGTIEAVAPLPAPGAPATSAASSAPIAVCMATYEPDLHDFRPQIESIRSQTSTEWHCYISDDGSRPATLAAMNEIITDDERFSLVAHPDRVGFYRNFERALRLVPPGTRYVALADQDDRWYPNKLERLRSALSDGDVTLACCDARIVDRAGTELAASFYANRQNTAAAPTSLFMVNSVIGASMMFVADLLPAIVELPARHLQPFHDHWIARVAVAAGPAVFLDEVLYDYVQHGGNVHGYGTAGQHWRGELVHPWARLTTGLGDRERDEWARYHEALDLDAAEGSLALRRVDDIGRTPSDDARSAVHALDVLDDAGAMALGRISAAWLYDQFARRRPRHESIELLHLRGMVWKRLQMN